MNVYRNYKITLIFIVLSGFTLLLFRDAITSYFFQDDWFSFLISRATDIKEFLNFFAPRTDVVYYRPLGMQIPFFLMKSLFGVNPLPFRIATFAFHVLNSYLVFRFLYMFLKNKVLAEFGAGLYMVSAVHFILFYWAATFAFIIIPTFYLGSMIAYIQKKSRLGFVLFFAGLLTNELIITLPIMLFLYELLIVRKIKLLNLTPFFIFAAGYSLFRFNLTKFPTYGNYAYSIDPQLIGANLRNYLFASFNLPEEIANQFVTFWQLNPLFVREFGRFLFPGTILLVMFMTLILYKLTRFFTFKDKAIKPESLFALTWFVVGLFPVLFYAHHFFPYYLPIPLVGILLFFILELKIFFVTFYKNKFLQIGLLSCFFGIWYWSSTSTVNFNRMIHWAPRRALLSQELIKKTLPTLQATASGGKLFVQIPGGGENLLVLGDQNAFKVLFEDDQVMTEYESR